MSIVRRLQRGVARHEISRFICDNAARNAGMPRGLASCRLCGGKGYLAEPLSITADGYIDKSVPPTLRRCQCTFEGIECPA